MLLTIILLSLGLCITDAKQDAEGLKNLVEFRLRDLETRMQDEKEKLEEMEMKLTVEKEDRQKKRRSWWQEKKKWKEGSRQIKITGWKRGWRQKIKKWNQGWRNLKTR